MLAMDVFESEGELLVQSKAMFTGYITPAFDGMTVTYDNQP